jgi:peptidoglycan/LPS O-acetylase OafA/YrhL
LAFMGRCGVDFFFILSGVVIFMAHSNDLSKPSRIRPFLWKRFRRIYPIYWIMLIPTIAIQLFQLTNNVRNPWTVLSNFLLTLPPENISHSELL